MAPIKSTTFGYMSIVTDKVETDNNIAGIGATYTTSEVFEPGNGYRYLFYTAPGYLNVNRGGSVDLLIVGGGGGGGRGQFSPPSNHFGGGGGGAGGYFEDFNFTLPIGEYDISIGAGGGISNDQNVPGIVSAGLPGTPTYIIGPGITSITAYGGGGGAGGVDSPNIPGAPGSDGGSGGGGSGHNGDDFPGGTGNRTSAQYPSTGSPIPTYLQGSGQPQGNDGGEGSPSFRGGGGGGAGNAGGVAGGMPNAGYGGDGRAAWTNDAGIPPSYGDPGPTPGRYFAGGGGGGWKLLAPQNNGGAGGGGQGEDDDSPNAQTATAGQVNTGGGGGGGDGFDTGKPGGSGIVIIRYRI